MGPTLLELSAELVDDEPICGCESVLRAILIRSHGRSSFMRMDSAQAMHRSRFSKVAAYLDSALPGQWFRKLDDRARRP